MIDEDVALVKQNIYDLKKGVFFTMSFMKLFRVKKLLLLIEMIFLIFQNKNTV